MLISRLGLGLLDGQDLVGRHLAQDLARSTRPKDLNLFNQAVRSKTEVYAAVTG